MRPRDYTKEYLIKQLLMLAEELGRTPTSVEFNEDPRTAASVTAAKFFGSWNKFLKAAGLDINKKHDYTKEELTGQLLMLAKELGRTPTTREFDKDSRTANSVTAAKFSGSWNEFLKTAGLSINMGCDYTKEELTEQLLMLAEELGRTPTTREFDKDSRTASMTTIRKLFGSWNKFLEAARLSVNMKYDYTKEELTEQLLMLAKELGRTPTSIEFNEDPRTASSMTAGKFFGSWNKFLEVAGLKINRGWQIYTKEELIQQVLMLAEELGRTPTSREFNEDARTASIGAIYRLFDSWNELLEAAGLKINLKRRSYTKEELIQQVLVLAKELGRTPTGKEFNEDARTASTDAAKRLFGSWNELLKTAGLKPNLIRESRNTK